MSVPIPLHEAQARLLADIAPLPAETVLAEAAAGRCLATPLTARRTQPAADLSAMDGYAMKAGETGPWRVAGESAAGHPFQGTVNEGEAIRISTGALMPDGADAVLLQENTSREGDQLILINEDGPTPRHIRRKGFDFRERDMLLPAGTRIGPGQLALILSAGNTEVSVHRLPRLAILDSGDELATDPADLALHRIPASNGAMLAAMTAGLAAKTNRLGPVNDDLGALAKALDAADDADVIVTSGGASVGDHDLIYPALEAWGATIDFWRVKMKPGKPILVARKGTQVVLGLPGNPVSSFVTAYLFLLPLLRALAGDRDPLPRPAMLPLGAGVPAGGDRLEFRRGRYRNGVVTSLEEQDSSALRTLAHANVLIERPAEAPAAPEGALVPAYLLGNGGVA